jgi:hypothetical protein
MNRELWTKRYAGNAPQSFVFPERKSKYKNKSVFIDGLRFDSKLEADRYLELKALQASGEVAWFIRQVPFQVATGVIYRADFLVVWVHPVFTSTPDCMYVDHVTVEDCKGYLTPVSKVKMAAVQDKYGIKIKLLTRADVKKS